MNEKTLLNKKKKISNTELLKIIFNLLELISTLLKTKLARKKIVIRML